MIDLNDLKYLNMALYHIYIYIYIYISLMSNEFNCLNKINGVSNRAVSNHTFKIIKINGHGL